MEGLKRHGYEGDIEVALGSLVGSLYKTKRKWRRLGQGGVIFKRAEAVFWHAKGFIRSRRVDFSVPYDAIANAEEERRPSRVVFGFSTPQVCPHEPPLKVVVLGFRPLLREEAQECVEQWWRRYESKEGLNKVSHSLHLRGFAASQALLEDGIFGRSKVTGRFSVDEGVALYSTIFPSWVGDAREEVTNVIVNLIKFGRLDGFFDEESGQYTAAALVPRRVTQVSIDFNSLLAALGEKGIALQHLTCPSCGGKLSLPQRGDLIECEYCGAAVRAVDMLEKFRGLLDL